VSSHPQRIVRESRKGWSVAGKVVYVSADTLKKKTGRVKEIHYRVHVKSLAHPVLATTGTSQEIRQGF
jgi:membrane fusion protein, adhesin transport system